MNQLSTNNERLPMDSVGMTNGATGAKIAPQNLAEVVKFAEVMCRADIALPKHLRGNAGACMAVSLQALDWQMNPFAVASKSYSVNGTIAYEAQLIAAVVNTRSGIKGRLRYSFEGTGNAMTCTVTGTLDGEEYSYTSPPVGSITTKNSPLWKTDPQQQLGYYSARSWARRYTPEVLLGVYDRDEAEEFRGPDNAKDVTPSQPSVMERLKSEQKQPQAAHSEREGFSATFTQFDGESELVTEIEDEYEFTGDMSSQASPDAAEGESSTSETADEGAGDVSLPQSAPSSNSDKERLTLIRFARDVLPKAADPDANGNTLKAIEKRWGSDIEKMSDEGREKARSISTAMRAVFNGSTSLESAAQFYAEALGTTEAVILGKEEV